MSVSRLCSASLFPLPLHRDRITSLWPELHLHMDLFVPKLMRCITNNFVKRKNCRNCDSGASETNHGTVASDKSYHLFLIFFCCCERVWNLGSLVRRRLLIRMPLYEIQKSVRENQTKGASGMVGAGGRMFPHACQSLSKFRIDEAHRQRC